MAAPELSFALRPEQRMLLLPRMLQALDVLQLPRGAVDDLVASALTENEALRRRSEAEPGAAESRPWKERRRRRADPRNRQARRLEELPGAAPSLRDHLHGQIAALEAPARVLELLRFLADSLDDRGLRTIEDAEWARAVDPPATLEELAACEKALRTLEPRGVGARDTISALLCQVSETDPDRPFVEAILRHHLEDLARHRRGVVANALGVSVEELALLLEKIASLHPRPSRGFATGAAPVVRPDVRVRRRGARLEVIHVEADAFAVEIDPEVAALARDRGTPAALRAHLRERLESAKELLQCLDQRRQTLERVVQALFLRQAAFLECGRKHLRPLRMQDLARALGIHPSTISRTVAGKYVETDWGVLRLRDFFEAGVATTAGREATRSGLREAVRQCFANEPPDRPLDDEDARRLLRSQGFVLARRTVAKYRAELGIPSSWQRARAAAAVAASTEP